MHQIFFLLRASSCLCLDVGLDVGSGASSSVGSSSFNENVLLLKPLKTFSLASKSNCTLFRKNNFFNWFHISIHTLELTD